MFIDKWPALFRDRQIELADSFVSGVVLPVDRVGEVHFLVGVVDIAVEFLIVGHEGVLLVFEEECVAVASHEDTSDADIAADVECHVAGGGSRCAGIVHLEHRCRVASSIDVALYGDFVRSGVALDAYVDTVGERSPRVDVDNLLCVACREI